MHIIFYGKCFAVSGRLWPTDTDRCFVPCTSFRHLTVSCCIREVHVWVDGGLSVVTLSCRGSHGMMLSPHSMMHRASYPQVGFLFACSFFFRPLSKDMQLAYLVTSKLLIGVNVSVCVCLSSHLIVCQCDNVLPVKTRSTVDIWCWQWAQSCW